MHSILLTMLLVNQRTTQTDTNGHKCRAKMGRGYGNLPNVSLLASDA